MMIVGSIETERGRLLASAIGFTEGPVRWGDNSILVTSMTRGLIYEVQLDDSVPPQIFLETGGGPNGLAVTADKNLLITQSGGSVMKSRSAKPARPSIQQRCGGEIATLSTDVHSPSDCVVGPDGQLWFTDPADHDLTNPTANGCVRRLDLSNRRSEVMIPGLSFPNGIAFAADPASVYIAETAMGRIRRYRLSGATWAHDGWEALLPTGRPDGIALDEAGWLWVAGSTGANVIAFGSDGEVIREIDFGDGHLVTSVCFAGPDLTTMVATSAKGGSVFAFPAINPGLALPAFRPNTPSR